MPTTPRTGRDTKRDVPWKTERGVATVWILFVSVLRGQSCLHCLEVCASSGRGRPVCKLSQTCVLHTTHSHEQPASTKLHAFSSPLNTHRLPLDFRRNSQLDFSTGYGKKTQPLESCLTRDEAFWTFSSAWESRKRCILHGASEWTLWTGVDACYTRRFPVFFKVYNGSRPKFSTRLLPRVTWAHLRKRIFFNRRFLIYSHFIRPYAS